MACIILWGLWWSRPLKRFESGGQMKTLLLTHEGSVCSAEKSIPTAHMNCRQPPLHRCVELIALWRKLACDKQGWGSRASVGSKGSTCEVTENMRPGTAWSAWNSGWVNLCQLFSWFCQLLFHRFCLALPSEIAILIKYLLFLPNSVLKSMPAAPVLFFFPFSSHVLWSSMCTLEKELEDHSFHCHCVFVEKLFYFFFFPKHSHLVVTMHILSKK